MTDTQSGASQDPVTHKPPFLVRRRTTFTWIIPLLLIAAVCIFRLNAGGIVSVAAGIAFIVLGEIVRFWAAGYISKDAVIATGGPYAHVRNPLYFGSLLLAVGYGLVSGLGIWGVAAMLAAFFIFHLAAIRYEEGFLKNKFGQPYLDYLARVPRIIPSPTARTQGEGSFAWEQSIRNREHTSALFAVVFVAALVACRYLLR